MKKTSLRSELNELNELKMQLKQRDDEVRALTATIEETTRRQKIDADTLAAIRKKLTRRSDGAKILWHIAQALLVGIAVDEKHHAFILIQAMKRTAEEMGEAAGWEVPGTDTPWTNVEFAPGMPAAEAKTT